MKSIIIFLFTIILTAVGNAQQLLQISSLDESSYIDETSWYSSGNSIEDVLVVGDTIWVATSKGLCKSGDNGMTWTNYYGSLEFEEESISSVSYYRGIVWVTTWHAEERFGSVKGFGSGIKYSTDNGLTWITIPQPVDQERDTTIVYGINTLKSRPQITTEDNFIYNLAFSDRTLWIASLNGGVRKSIDMGVTWERVVLPPDYFNEISPENSYNFELSPIQSKYTTENNLNQQVFSVFALDDSVIYVGTANGVNKSTDGGISWRKLSHTNQQFPIGGNHVVKIGYNEFTNSIWIANWKTVIDSEVWGLSSSSDGGDTWNTFLPGEKTHGIGFGYYCEVNNIIGSSIIAATENGLFMSANNGETWLRCPSIKDDNPNFELKTNSFTSISCQYKNDGTIDLWIGSLNGLVRLEEFENYWSGNWSIFFASQPLTSADKSYTFPNPFHPGRDIGVTRFKYSTSGLANVTIRIFDFGMNLVRTVIQNANRNLTLHDAPLDYWDGRDDKGRIVPNGIYFYRIDIDSNDQLYGKILVVR